MTPKLAILRTLESYPPNYLQREAILHAEANNLSATVFSHAEMLAELHALERERLVLRQPVHDLVKWKITGAGRAWLKEA